MASTKNSKIFKNTIVLYIRSIVVLILTLYTSRVILYSLGIKDYGLYSVVGGVVTLFSFMRTSMTKSTQRFLNVDMVNHSNNLNMTFCVSMNIHIIIAIIAILLTETIGLWILNTYIQIPFGRVVAANVIYQSTILSFIFTIVSVPYSADIIAHEEMGYLAVVSIIDAILKLIIAFAITWGSSDHLIFYGILMALVSILNFLMYYVFCRIKYAECRYRFVNDAKKIREMIGYTSWTVLGQAAIIGTNQGSNILINMFHSVTANAAMGIAHQVNSGIVTLTSNFQTAFNPQITKSYAAKDYNYLQKLVYTTCKISYFLLVVASLPIMFNLDYLLNLWLVIVPEHSAEFCILIICNSILNALSAPFNFTVLSSSKIKVFQLVTSLVFLSDLIILYPLFLIGFPAVTALVVKLFIMALVSFVRIYFAHRLIPCIQLNSFLKRVILPLAISTAISVAGGFLMFYYTDNLFKNLVATLLLICLTICSTIYIGLSSSERMSVYALLCRCIGKK